MALTRVKGATFSAGENFLSENVKDFGATGDGTTDDRAAIVSAIAAALTGSGSVFFPQGAYVIDTAGGTVDIPEGVGLFGEAGDQIRDPSVTKQGAVIYVKGVATSPFTYNRGVTVRGLNFYWPDQPINTSSPTAYAFAFTPGSAGGGKSTFQDLLFINADKGIKSGDLAGAIPGGALFMDNVKGMFFREMIRIENSFALSHIDHCASSAVFAPGDTTLSQNFASANLDVLHFNGRTDGVRISDFTVFRANRFIFMEDTLASGTANSNFMRIADGLCDGIRQGLATSGTAGVLSAQFDNVFFKLDDINDATVAPIAFDFTFSAGPSQIDKTAMFSNCRFVSAAGVPITVGPGTDGLDRLIVSDCTFRGWAQGSAAPINSGAITINRAQAKVSIDNCDFFKSAGSASAIAVRADSFDSLRVNNCKAESTDRGFVFIDGNILTFSNNVSVGSTTVGAVQLGTITSIVWDHNQLDIYPTTSRSTRPSFRATSNVGQTLGVGPTTIQYNVENFDRGSNYDNTTFTFTSPIAGEYVIDADMTLDGAGMVVGDVWAISIVASNRTANASFVISTVARQSFEIHSLMDMDAGDTALVQVQRISGSGTVTLLTSGSTNQFSARLSE